ncbi:MAG TPA: GxxExxY protein [Spirochaetota bacterium]|nr:GxxExxY protein [Spirochaetota bacterium]
MNNVTEVIIGSAFEVANVLGAGFLEKVYENALCVELNNKGLIAEKQKRINVYYKDVIVGDYYADILVNNDIILELKTVKSIEMIHIAQCLNYLKATDKRLGLIINFGNQKVEIKRIRNDGYFKKY